MGTKPYVTGDLVIDTWRHNESQQLTFVVTQECNLRCGYCYMVGKNDKHTMDFGTAKRIMDYFIDNREELFVADYVVLDFIGGEPLLEIDLIDKMVDYFRLTTYQKKSRWFGKFRIMMQSNGVLVDSEKFQKFLRKNRNMVSLGITIDGTERKHDLQRVFPNGEGSYSIVEKNYKMAMEQGLINSTKVTFGHEDLKYIKESIIHLWSLGIKNIPGNIVFEDVWEEGDDIIYEEQLTSLADYIIDNDLWNEYNTTLFFDDLGFKATDEAMMNASCGVGNMYCVDNKGDIYNGIDLDKKRALQTLFPKYISEQKCIDCRISMNCPYCAGYNYDASDTDSLFYRATAICDMHKARVRANNYFWARLYNERSISRQIEYKNEYFMYFILSSECVNYCDFPSAAVKVFMKPKDFIKGLEYAFYHFYQPVFVHSEDSEKWLDGLLHSEQYGELLSKELKRHIVRHIKKYESGAEGKNTLYVFDDGDEIPDKDLHSPVILNIDAKNIVCLADRVRQILPFVSRININLIHVDYSFDLTEYKKQLQQIENILLGYFKEGICKEIRQLTDRIFSKKMNNCFAGEKNITLAPDGKFYFCPAFYFDKNLDTDFEKSQKFTMLSKAPGCDSCDAYQCNRCVYKNCLGTGELNTPTKLQCTMAHLERKCSAELLERLKDQKIFHYESYQIPPLEYDDPLEQYNKK
ncbi:MAG: CXXX repeat peptide maturase, partial [Lachnospiraceae bacterium]|nr:CXXX repeat peptide maturase [Lachnospiraceae bacterium]